ncbi:hypothetical protein [Pseudoalteromonas sp. Q18-MNA-CIBAN-0097]|uniref:hypothetical protein n=1 Tax=Pseudoalteromonas sp. Q18-MNA-CIBAN-0097 TaxID=3140440 RepID=UPI00332BEE35
MSNLNQDLTPEEQQRLQVAQKQHNESINASKNLENTIKKLAKTNSRTKNETQFTDNRLEIRQFTDSMRQSMSNETSKLFEQLEEMNVDARKQTKSEQRDNLKQLDVLRELSKNIQDDEQKLQLQKFVDTTEQSIKANSNRFTSFVSGVSNNFGDIGAVLAGLNDSPLLSMGMAYFGNKINDKMNEKREQKYSLQEGAENQLFELLSKQEQNSKKKDALLEELANRENVQNTVINNNETTSNENSKTGKNNNKNNELSSIHDQLVSIDDGLSFSNNASNENDSQEPIQVSVNNEQSYSLQDLPKLDTTVIQDLLDGINYELIDINENIINLNKSNYQQDSQEPVQVPIDSDGRINEQLITISKQLEPLINGLEERRRESELFNDKLLDSLNNFQSKNASLKKNDSDGGSMLGGIVQGIFNPKKLLGGLKNVLGKTFKSIGKSIPRLLGRIALPAMVVGSLVNGVMDGFNEFKKSGNMKEAVFAAAGGMLDFITFGLFGKDELQGVTDKIKESTGRFFDVLSTPFHTIVDFVDSVFTGSTEDVITNLAKLNPIYTIGSMITDSFTIIMDELGKQFDVMIQDVKNYFKDFKLPDFNLDLPSFDLFGDDKTTSDVNSKKTVQKDSIAPIENGRSGLRKEIGSVFKVQDIPMTKDNYTKAAKKAVEGGNSAGNGANNYNSLVNVSNNTQTIVAPLPTVHSNDYNIRRLNNNPY